MRKTMKTYFFIYEHGQNDINENPRHWVTVYRIKDNRPAAVGVRENVGHRDQLQAVCDAIQKNETGWSKNAHYLPDGNSCNAVYKAKHDGEINIIQIGNVEVR